ncbi:MAG: UGSC family (seleno)protein, partial [Desulfatiglandales bacterium]|nr:UGSC family (seleno)protein [Desulfatiglandales bacterium]
MIQKPKLSASRIEVSDSVEDFYELVLENRWGDGLPVIPPTEERVMKMFAGLDRKPSDVTGGMPPSNNDVTIEKIAVNAVMAGCLPEYMPILIAAVEAMIEPSFNLHGIQATTSPVAPLVIVNGPIRGKVNLNCGRGCFGPGWRANATIGRAIRFLLINIGGALSGDVDMATYGSPAKYTFCIGEDEENSP